MRTSQEQWLVNRAKYGQHRYTCPWCSPTRKKKTETCLSALRDDTSIKFQCHHGDCGVTGLIPLTERLPYKMVQSVEKKQPSRPIDTFDKVDDRHLDWLSKRGISAKTAQEYDLIGEEIYGKAVVGFPYFDENGGVVAVKKRFVDEKKFLCEGSPSSFFGIRHIKRGDDLIICEGEADVLALAEAGIRAVSIPNGASMKVTDGKLDPEEDTKFRFLWAAKEFIDAAKRVIIATDMDAPGEAVAEEIARRVGKEKAWRVKFPEGLKDANDTLLKEGAEGVRKCLTDAEPWPISGLYDAWHFEKNLWDLYEKGVGRGESTGYDCVDEIYTVSPGQVAIVTGIPSSGKSEFIDQVMINLASNKGWNFAVCSFENEPRLHIAKLMSKRAQMPFFDGYNRRMNKEEANAAFDWVGEHFSFVHEDSGGMSDIDSIIERLRVAVLRFGIRGAVIDPANFLSRDDLKGSETEWVSTMLTKLKVFAMAHGIHIWLIAHPAKLYRGADGKIAVPKGYEISGSAHYFNKADVGITVHREMDNPHVAQIHIWKCRFSWVGKQGQTQLVYDIGTTCYREMDDYDASYGARNEEFQL